MPLVLFSSPKDTRKNNLTFLFTYECFLSSRKIRMIIQCLPFCRGCRETQSYVIIWTDYSLSLLLSGVFPPPGSRGLSHCKMSSISDIFVLLLSPGCSN